MKVYEFLQGVVILAAVALIFGLILAPAAFFRFQSIGRGSHTGYVTAVDQRGYIFRNYEVYFKTDTSSSQEDVYCVSRYMPGLADELRIAGEKRTLVTIRYQGVRGIGLGLCHETEIKMMEEVQ